MQPGPSLRDTLSLVRAAHDGNPEARDDLLARLSPRLVLWAGARMSRELRARHEPEDVAQEILLAIHRDFGRISPEDPAAFLPWVFAVAENRVRDLVDHDRAARRNGDPPPAPRVSGPATLAVRREQERTIARALETLSDDHREVIRLRRFENLSAADVATRMGRSEGAVRVLYFRAMGALRDALPPESE